MLRTVGGGEIRIGRWTAREYDRWIKVRGSEVFGGDPRNRIHVPSSIVLFFQAMNELCHRFGMVRGR